MVSSVSGKFIPFFDEIGPPWMTRVSTFVSSTAATTSSTRPSLMRMRWPICTSRGSGVNGVDTIDALPSTGAVVIVNGWPSWRCTTPSTSAMRSFGPWMSPMIGTYLPRSVAVRRMTSMTRRFSLDGLLGAAGGAEGGDDFRSAHVVGARGSAPGIPGLRARCRAPLRCGQRRLQRSSQHPRNRIHFPHQLRECLGQNRLRAVRQRLLGAVVYLDQDAI